MWRPSGEVAIEGFSTVAESALKLGQVRGVAMLAAPGRAEVASIRRPDDQSRPWGYGRAEKQQVQHMVNEAIELRGSGADGCVGCAGDSICHCIRGERWRQRAVAR